METAETEAASTPAPLKRSCEETHPNSFLKIERRAVSSRHEPRKCEQRAVDPMGEPTADELACCGCGAIGWRRSSGTTDLGAGRAFGSARVLPGHREQRGRRRAARHPRCQKQIRHDKENKRRPHSASL